MGNNLSSNFLLDLTKIIIPHYVFYLSNITMRVSPTQGILNAGHECIRPCTCLYLVSAVEQREDVSLLHGYFPWTLLLIVIQGKDQLFPSLIISWCHLLLFNEESLHLRQSAKHLTTLSRQSD